MNANKLSLVLLIANCLVLVTVSETFAQGKGNGGGKPDGGGGDPGPTILIAPFDQGTYATATDINDLREVVGHVVTESGDSQTAAYWTVQAVESDGEVVIESQRTILAGGDRARAINNVGEIVGVSTNALGNDVAVYWPDSSSAAIELPLLPGHEVSYAGSINNDGLIGGFVSKNVLDENGDPIPGTSDVPSNRAVVWRVASLNSSPVFNGPFELPSDGDSSSSTAHALNDNDEFGVAQVVGYRRSPFPGEGGAFLWQVQSHPDGTVSVATVPIGDGNPQGINNSGSVCGLLIGRSPSDVDAIVWSGGTVAFLDRGKGRNRVAGAKAWDISDSHFIVGEAGPNIFESRACFWDGIDGSLTYLDTYLDANSPLIGLDSADAVNAFGDIVGVGWTGAYIAIPVTPQP